MEEFVVSREELNKMFAKKELEDTNKGWYYRGKEVQIIAIHTVEKRYIQDLMNAENYKIKPVD